MCARTHQSTKSIVALLHHVTVDRAFDNSWSFPEFPHFHSSVGVVESTFEQSKVVKSVTQRPWGLQIADLFLGNARAETALLKPTWKQAAQSHRALMPVDCFYEKGVYFSSPTKPILALACLVVQGDRGPAVVVLTRPPVPSVAQIHDRMPLVIPVNKAEEWLDLNVDYNHFNRYFTADFSLVGTKEPRVLLNS